MCWLVRRRFPGRVPVGKSQLLEGDKAQTLVKVKRESSVKVTASLNHALVCLSGQE